jgi:hypothetical protein
MTKTRRLFKAKNIKVNRLKGKEGEQGQDKWIPVIPQMMEVLITECDFIHNKGKDKFIIASDKNRKTVYDLITKGFTHFKRVAGIEDEKCFKDLRTTYTTGLQKQYGDYDLTAIITDHTTSEVVKKHYIAQIEMAKKVKDFRIE